MTWNKRNAQFSQLAVLYVSTMGTNATVTSQTGACSRLSLTICGYTPPLAYAVGNATQKTALAGWPLRRESYEVSHSPTDNELAAGPAR